MSLQRFLSLPCQSWFPPGGDVEGTANPFADQGNNMLQRTSPGKCGLKSTDYPPVEQAAPLLLVDAMLRLEVLWLSMESSPWVAAMHLGRVP